LALTCPDCKGTRLNEHALAVRVGRDTIADVSARPVGELRGWLRGLALSPARQQVAQLILDQLDARLRYLDDVGLGYLTLDRQARTLSGGEAQRISLANALGSQLVDAMYVLDEPSIGLHPRDTDRLLALLHRLRDLGNTVLVVEHEHAAVREADYMLELGPGAGEKGGTVMHAGPPLEAGGTLTGQYLSGAKCIAVPSARRPAGPLWLRVRGATLHNLRGGASPRQSGPILDSLSRTERRSKARRHCPIPPRAGRRGGRALGFRTGVRRAARGPVADRPHPAVQPRHLREGVR
jgi:excinuclease ABC subunit A